MSSNYENAVHGRGRRVSVVTESNANLQEDNRLAKELQKIEKEKEKMMQKARRKSSAGQVIPPMPTALNMKRRASLAETRMQRTLSKHDLDIPVRARSNSVTTAVTTGDGSIKLIRSSSIPYGELLDKERFEKFCNATKKLSITSADQVKSELNIKEGDDMAFMGDMNVYLRMNNVTVKKGSGAPSGVIAEESEDGIEWENYVHPRTLEELRA